MTRTTRTLSAWAAAAALAVTGAIPAGATSDPDGSAASAAVRGSDTHSVLSIPADCTVKRYPYASWAVQSRCTQRAHRAAAQCRVAPNHTVNWYYGSWENKNETSIAYCPGATEGIVAMSVDVPD
ncbi:hypothetical protein [Saccharothrix lopnurensis]|uniref:Secreted protein n=1 Tax=Saccharothrix lopnurensis TaxID=1670621 RepID=A0ABW1PD71_9PSEU